MKNILSSKEFKTIKTYDEIYENINHKQSYGSLYESMDFSNRIGWSESLLGRAVNKIFSWGKTLTQKRILSDLKNQVENVFFKGVVLAMAKNGINANDIETVNLMVDVWLLENSQYDKIKDMPGSEDDILLQERMLKTWQMPTKFEKKIFYFDNVPVEVDFEKYKMLVIPDYPNVTLIDSQTTIPEEIKQSAAKFRGIKDYVKDDYEDILVITVQGENDRQGKKQIEEETYFVIINKVKSENKNTNNIEGQNTDSNTTGSTIATGSTINQLGAANISGSTNLEIEYKIGNTYIYYNKEGGKKPCRILSMENVIKPGKDTLYLTKDDVKTNDKIENGLVLVQFLDKEYNVTNSIISVDKSKLKEFWQEVKAEADTIIDKLLKNPNLKDEQKTKLDTLKKISNSFFNKEVWDRETDGGIKGQELLTNWKKFKELSKNLEEQITPKQIQNNQKVLTESRYTNFVIDRIFEKIDELIQNMSEAAIIDPNPPSNKTSIGTKIKTILFKKDAKASVGLNSDKKLSSILNSIRMSPEEHDMMKAYGKLDIGSLDQKGILKKFVDDANLRKQATELVDKEALKEIQLRAEWMYDREKYKDSRSDVYSRVNWNTTDPDKMKLENDWKKKLAKVKSDYTPFFGEENWNFPITLDPIALVNSDKDARTSFKQKDFSEHVESDKIKGNTNLKGQSEEEKEISKLLGLVSPPVLSGSYGVFRLNTTSNGRMFMMIFKHLQKENLHCFKYLGIIDYQSIEEDWKKSNTKDKAFAESLLKQYHYTKTETKTSSSIDNAKQEVKDIWTSFRGEKLNGKDISTKTDIVGFYYGSNINKGQAINSSQIVIHSTEQPDVQKKTWDISTTETYIAETNNTQTAIKGYVKLSDVKSSTNNFKFKLVIDQVYAISGGNEGIWGLGKLDDDDERDAAFLRLKDEIHKKGLA